MMSQLLPVGFNNTIERELRAVSLAVTEHRRALNNEGVWLFLAVLGCLGVNPPEFRLVALIAAMFLFGLRLAGNYSDKRTFTEMLEDVHKKVDELSVTELERKANLYDILQWQKRHLDRIRP